MQISALTVSLINLTISYFEPFEIYSLSFGTFKTPWAKVTL